MWKEAFIMGILSILGYERRKQQNPQILIDRRQGRGKLTNKRSKEMLQESIDRFSQTVIMHTPEKK